MDDAQKRELIGAHQTPVSTVPPLWVESEGVIKKIPDVIGECALAIVIGIDTTPNATSWQERATNAVNTWLQFDLLTLAVQDTTLGGFSVDASKDTNPSAYWRALEALARRLLGSETLNDKHIINDKIQYLHTVHREHLNDLNATIDRLKKEKDDAKESKSKKAKKAEEDEEDAAPVAPVVPKKVFIRTFDFDTEMSRAFIKKDDSEHLEGLVINPDDILVNVPVSGASADVMSKVTFTVAAVPNPKGTIIGYLIRILIHDKQWNPGEIIGKLIKQCTTRKTNEGNAYYKDPWPQYTHLQGTAFPVHNMTWGRWTSCVNEITGERPNYEKHIVQMSQTERAESRSSPTYPGAICNLNRALKNLKEAGGLVGNVGDYYESEGTAQWPVALRPLRFMSDTVFWDDGEKVGLFHQFFPFMIPFGGKDAFSPELINYARHCRIMTKEALRNLAPQFSAYKTGNILIHMATDCDKYEGKAKKVLPANYSELYKVYKSGVSLTGEARERVDLYQKTVKHYSSIWMQKFCTVCQLQGSPEYLNIPMQLKSMIKWYQEFTSSSGGAGSEPVPITREYELYDPDMDLFSNCVIRQLAQYEKFGKIVQPIIPYKLRGCFSVYQLRRGQTLYNLNLYGGAGAGKSWATVGFLGKMCIPGTFKCIDRCTGAADQTDQSVHDEIRGQHEMDEAFVNSEHGKKHVDKVNMKKSALTSGTLTLKMCEIQTIPGIGRVRAAKETTQAQNYTEVNCSNTQPGEDAIGSRYHNVLLGESTVPIEQMNFEVDSEANKGVLNDFRVNQLLSCWLEKAMSVFAIPCRKPFMGLFDDISSRMLETLRGWGALPDNGGSVRPLEIMSVMARQLTVEKALLLTFHTKGAPHYGKAFDPTQLTDCAPYLYCDSNITLLTWTLHSSDWIKADFGNVLRAAWRVAAGDEWDTNKSIYEYFQNDQKNRIKLKTTKNYSWSKEVDGNLNKTFTDMNMIELNVTDFNAAARAISAATDPKIPHSAVLAILETMAKHSFKPRSGRNGRNGYARSVYTDELRAHKGRQIQKRFYSPGNFKVIVDSFAPEIAPTLYYELSLLLAEQMNPEELQTFSKAKIIIDGIAKTAVQIIFMYLTKSIADHDSKDLRKFLTLDQMHRIIKSCSGLVQKNVQNPFTVLGDLTYSYALVLLYGMDRRMIREHGILQHVYMKLETVVDPLGVFFPRVALEDDILMLNDVHVTSMDEESFKPAMINIVEFVGKKKICFSPMAIELFDKKIIQDAFIDATMCKSMRPGKRIMGWTDERDPSKFKTLTITPEIIREKVIAYDDDALEGAVLRQSGIVFKRRGFIESSATPLLYGLGIQKDQKYKQSIEVVEDLDKWAATQQHLLCGYSFDEPVKDVEWIHANYLNAGGKVGTTNYPDDIIKEKLKHSAEFWAPNTTNSKKKNRSISSI